MRKCFGVALVALLAPVFAHAEESTDVFGFQKFYQTEEGTYSWDSRHWANGNARSLANWASDTQDPTQWTDNRSSDAGGFYVDGQGTMQMLGSGPRFHINGQQDGAPNKQKFKNVEYTGYFKRDALGGQDYGGMVVGVRSGALGHGSSGGNNCDAHTYYARFRNDGKWDFEKEWKHPGSYYRSGSGVGRQDPLWGGNVLPVDKWIGMKYIVYNKDDATVHLEVYIDSTSGATPPGKWELVGSADDSGTDWSGASYGAATIDGCSYTDAKAAILQAGDAIVMRSDNDHPYYKFVTVREINPAAPFGEDVPPGSSGSSVNPGPGSSSGSGGSGESTTAIKRTYRPSLENVPIRHFDLLGRPAEKDVPQRIYRK